MNEMSDEEKSVKLAKLRGWGITESSSGNLVWIDDPETGEEIITINMTGGGHYGYTTLYDPVNMALAEKIKTWAFLNPRISDILADWGSAMTSLTIGNHTRHAPRWWILIASNQTQRAWLDKILELAITAGLDEE